jgi:hypothetical protein
VGETLKSLNDNLRKLLNETETLNSMKQNSDTIGWKLQDETETDSSLHGNAEKVIWQSQYLTK